MNHAILRPVVALVAWTLVMLVWMLATRLPAMAGAGIRLRSLIGTKPADADRGLPPAIQWKAHNHNHLHEQPTLFYAVCLVLALAGGEQPIGTWLAWAYVALRIAHSLVQATVNRVAPRLCLFLAASLVLAALTLHAAWTIV